MARVFLDLILNRCLAAIEHRLLPLPHLLVLFVLHSSRPEESTGNKMHRPEDTLPPSKPNSQYLSDIVRSVALPVSQEGQPQPLIEPSRFASQWPRFQTPEGTNLETPIQVGQTHRLATPKLPNSQALASMFANANANCRMTKREAF